MFEEYEEEPEVETIRERTTKLLGEYDRPWQEISARCDNVMTFFGTGIYQNLEHRVKRFLDFLNVIAMISADVRVGDIEDLPLKGLERFEETVNLHREHILRVIDWDEDLFDAWLAFNSPIEWGDDDFIVRIKDEADWREAHKGVLDYVFRDMEEHMEYFINPGQPFASDEMVKEFMAIFQIK